MDFVIVGPEKCGTSWVDRMLRTFVPGALPKTTKETFYFDRLHHLGTDWHDAQFEPGDGPRGEVSPSYFASEAAAARIREAHPDCRIVVILRDPYDRMESHLVHLARRGKWRPSAGPAKIPPALAEEARSSSRYALHGERWRDLFGADNVLFLDYDDIAGDPPGLAARLLDHIRLDVPIDRERLVAFSKVKVFEAAEPRSVLFARLGYRVSRSLQHLGLVKVVERLRRSRLRRMMERSRPADDPGRLALGGHIRSHEDFEDDVTFAEVVLHKDLPSWRR